MIVLIQFSRFPIGWRKHCSSSWEVLQPVRSVGPNWRRYHSQADGRIFRFAYLANAYTSHNPTSRPLSFAPIFGASALRTASVARSRCASKCHLKDRTRQACLRNYTQCMDRHVTVALMIMSWISGRRPRIDISRTSCAAESYPRRAASHRCCHRDVG